jgi:branched-subunit amino acid transport protein
MTVRRPTPGDVLDELIQNPRRLGIAHACLGLVAAFVYWARPGTFTPHLVRFGFRDASPIYMTVVAWIPYVIAFLVSKATLADRNHRAVLAYICFASLVTLAASGLYLNLFGMHATLSPALLAGGVTITLLAAVGLCAAIWRSDTSDT